VGTRGGSVPYCDADHRRILWGTISRQTDRLPHCKRDKMKPRWRKRDLLSEEGHTIVRTQRTAEGKRAFEQITPVMAEPRTLGGVLLCKLAPATAQFGTATGSQSPKSGPLVLVDQIGVGMVQP
jgi:hypothetical protein